MSETPERDRPVVHELNNQLAIIIGFSELLLDNLPEGDPNRADVLEIMTAARAAMALTSKVGRADPH